MKKVIGYFVLFGAMICIYCANSFYKETLGIVTLYAPSKVYASAVVIRWNRTISESFASYNIFYDTKPNVSDTSTLAASIIYKNDTTYLLSGLDDNTTYYVKVFVYNSASYSESNEISFTTVPCTCGLFTGEKEDGMILIPAGCFIGKDTSIAAISYDFFMDTTEVTIAEWNAIMNAASIVDTTEISKNEWDFILKMDTSTSLKPKAAISKYQMIIFCNEKSKKNTRDTCYTFTSIHIDTMRLKITDIINLECDFTSNGFRLPTEDEWEYAYHAGKPEEYFWGKDGNTLADHPYTTTYPINDDDTAEISEYVWWKYNNEPYGPKDVAQRKPNNWHLYDIAGNIEETVWDLAFVGERDKSRIDYTMSEIGPQSSKSSITRGGSFKTSKPYLLTAWCRLSNIDFDYSDDNEVGLRVVSTKVP